MSEKVKRTTICFESGLHKSLRLKAAETSCSISELVNQAVRISLNDDDTDCKTINERKSEAQISFDEMVEQLKRDGFIEDKARTR
jgi:hypothetical protein